MIDKDIVLSICKEAGLGEDSFETVENLLKETIKLGIFSTNHFTKETLSGLVPFVKTYVEEIVNYGKNPEMYIKNISDKLRQEIS